MKHKYNMTLIDDQPYLMGAAGINPEPLFNLVPGDRVTQIGGGGINYGRQTSSARLDTFDPWVEYAGTIVAGGDTWMCFKLPPQGVMDMKGVEPAEQFFKLYCISIIKGRMVELLVPKPASQCIRIFQIGFKKLEHELQQ